MKTNFTNITNRVFYADFFKIPSQILSKDLIWMQNLILHFQALWYQLNFIKRIKGSPPSCLNGGEIFI